MAETLYLEVNPDGIVQGAARGKAAMRDMEESARRLGREMDRASQHNYEWRIAVDGMSGAWVRTTPIINSAAAATTRLSVSSLAASTAQKALNVAQMAGTRIVSGLLRAVAITPIVAMSSAILELTTNLVANALGFNSAADGAEKYADAMERAATEAQKAARAAQTASEIGDTATAALDRKARLEALRQQYANIRRADPNALFQAEDFTRFGVPVPPNQTMVQRSSRVFDKESQEWSTLTATVPGGYTKMDAADAFSSYIRAHEEGEKETRAVTAAEKSLGSRLKALYSQYETISGLPPQLQGAYVGAKVRSAFSTETYDPDKLRAQTIQARLDARYAAAKETEAEREKEAAKQKREAEREAARAEAQFQRSADGFASGFESASQNLLTGMTDLGGAFQQFAMAIQQQIIRQLVTEPAGQAVGAGIASFFSSPAPSAMGNAFDRGVVPFASGGVVRRPTMFAYGADSLGIMGEAGPEAVMPLRRGRDGRLGVAAGGGQAPVVVNMRIATPDPNAFRRSAAQLANRQAALVRQSR